MPQRHLEIIRDNSSITSQHQGQYLNSQLYSHSRLHKNKNLTVSQAGNIETREAGLLPSTPNEILMTSLIFVNPFISIHQEFVFSANIMDSSSSFFFLLMFNSSTGKHNYSLLTTSLRLGTYTFQWELLCIFNAFYRLFSLNTWTLKIFIISIIYRLLQEFCSLLSFI